MLRRNKIRKQKEDLLNEARSLLKKVFVHFNLPKDLPLKECVTDGFLAFSNIELTPFKPYGKGMEKADIVKINWIEVRLERETKKVLLPLSTIIASFLHEIAHCLSPQYKKKNGKKEWYYDDHGAHFYEGLVAVLRWSFYCCW